MYASLHETRIPNSLFFLPRNPSCRAAVLCVLCDSVVKNA